MRRFIARPATFFDSGTEADLIEDYRSDGSYSGLFYGRRDGKWLQAVCRFSEFTVKYVSEGREKRRRQKNESD